jgi:PAS domain S-box-containing protein
MTPGRAASSVGELAMRLRQQELVSRLGRFALRHDDLQMILQEACVAAAEGLGTRFAKVLEYLPAEKAFLIRAGVGWREGVVGHAKLKADIASPAGYAFRTGQRVIANELGTESRFRIPALLREHGIGSMINVLIGGGVRPPFGVLEVDSTGRAEFNENDVAFLESLANTLADAVEKQQRLELLRAHAARLTSVLDISPDLVKVFDAGGRLQTINAAGLHLMEIEDYNHLKGRPWEEFWPPSEAGKVLRALATARGGELARFEAQRPTAKGAPKLWDVWIAPVPGPDHAPVGFVSISRDITDLAMSREKKDELLQKQDLQMQEVHHRVKNSLQMVQNLLSLQARESPDSATAGVLRESAGRVRIFAAIHDRLYRGTSGDEVAIAPYLQGLIDDLHEAMASMFNDREVRLVADDARWRAADVPTLGLVLTELVTNALKYGAGVVTVTFRQKPGEQPSLTVEDEGNTLPEDFDPGRSRGLGMRIVTGLLRRENCGLFVDPSQGYTRFRALLPGPSAAAHST